MASIRIPTSADEANLLLRQADDHLTAGEPAEARPLIEAVLRFAPDHPQILQLHAVVLRALGEHEAALEAATRAFAGAGDDPRIADTLGNILGDLGQHDDALLAYERALAAAPGFADAALHRAMTLQALGRPNEARAAFIAIGNAAGPDGPVARALLEIEQGSVDDAAILFEHALKITPGFAPARHGRLRVALDRGEPDAFDVLVAVQESEPQEPGLLLDRLELIGDAPAVAQAEALLVADPTWRAGRNALARWRRERAGRDDWLALHRRALAVTPDDAAVWRDLIDLHSVADEFGPAADAAQRAAAATGDAAFTTMAFSFLAASGQAQAAERLLGQPDIAGRIDALALAQFRLVQGDAEIAERLLATLCDDATRPGVEAWALRGIAWQMLGDPRFAWLNDQPGMIVDLDLGLDAGSVAAIVARLTALHDAAIINLGQSVRGGTQTHGNLFDRIDPEVRQLRDAVRDAVERFRAALPPADPTHPLLRHRDQRMRLTASWSVRLNGSGFHVSHIHPKGIFSSASYWVLPPATAEGSDARAGWLELGRPPAYLGLDLPPIRTIEPRVGHLILFPSTLHHGTRPFGTGQRITAAFDVAPASER